jgi:hypothetical protein
VIKTEGGEKESGEKTLSRRKRPSRKKRQSDIQEVFIIILGFVSAAFGFLLLLTPANYPIDGIPATFNPLVGIALIGLGLYLLLRSD